MSSWYTVYERIRKCEISLLNLRDAHCEGVNNKQPARHEETRQDKRWQEKSRRNKRKEITQAVGACRESGRMKLVCGWTVGGQWTLTWCGWRTFIGITGNISRNRPADHSPNQPIAAKNNSTRNGKQKNWKQNKTKQQVYFLFSFTVFFRY